MESFERAVADFRRFLIQQDYPPNLLWLTPNDVVFWGLRYFFWKGDPSERESRAKTSFSNAMAANVGIALQAQCKTDRWAICRLYVPEDELDAERRMIPKTGVKVAATIDPKPAMVVDKRIQWWLLKWLVRNRRPCWD